MVENFFRDRSITEIKDPAIRGALEVLARAARGLSDPLSAREINRESLFRTTRAARGKQINCGGSLGPAAPEKLLFRTGANGVMIRFVWIQFLTNATYNLGGVPQGGTLGAAPPSPYINAPDYMMLYQTALSVVAGSTFPWWFNTDPGFYIPGNYDVNIKAYGGGVQTYRIIFIWEEL